MQVLIIEAALRIPLGLGQTGKLGSLGRGIPTVASHCPQPAQLLCHTASALILMAISCLFHLCQEGISEVSGWLFRVPGPPALSQQVLHHGHKGLLPREDLVKQPWDMQEHWECVQNL